MNWFLIFIFFIWFTIGFNRFCERYIMVNNYNLHLSKEWIDILFEGPGTWIYVSCIFLSQIFDKLIKFIKYIIGVKNG